MGHRAGEWPESGTASVPDWPVLACSGLRSHKLRFESGNGIRWGQFSPKHMVVLMANCCNIITRWQMHRGGQIFDPASEWNREEMIGHIFLKLTFPAFDIISALNSCSFLVILTSQVRRVGCRQRQEIFQSSLKWSQVT